MHNDIDTLPLYIWFKVNETSDLRYLIKKGRPKAADLEAAWFLIMDGYIKHIGLNEDYKEILRIKQKLYIAKIDYAISISKGKEDRVLLNFIQIYEHDLEQLNIPESKQDEYELIAIVEKYMSIKVDPQKDSVRKFYNYLKLIKLEQDSKELNKK